MIEDETIISNDVEVVGTTNELYVTVTDSLGINENSNYENTREGITDPVDKVVYKFSNHPSILNITDHCQNVSSCHFQKGTRDAVDREVRDLNPKKATTHKNVPAKILKSNSDVCIEPFTQIFNGCIEHSSSPNELKCTDVTSLPKNGPSNTRTNFSQLAFCLRSQSSLKE